MDSSEVLTVVIALAAAGAAAWQARAAGQSARHAQTANTLANRENQYAKKSSDEARRAAAAAERGAAEAERVGADLARRAAVEADTVEWLETADASGLTLTLLNASTIHSADAAVATVVVHGARYREGLGVDLVPGQRASVSLPAHRVPPLGQLSFDAALGESMNLVKTEGSRACYWVRWSVQWTTEDGHSRYFQSEGRYVVMLADEELAALRKAAGHDVT